MFQETRLIPSLSDLKNVEIAMHESDAAKAEQWLMRVGLGDVKNSLPSELSGGQQRRVSLARALAFGAELLLLDEPLTGLDPDLVRNMAELIKEQNAQIIAVTHSENEQALFGGTIVTL